MSNEINSIRNKIVTPLTKFKNEVKGGKKARSICQAFYNLLLDLKIPDRLDKKAKAFEEKGNLIMSLQYKQLFNIFISIIDQIVEVFKDEKLTITALYELITIAITDYSIATIPASIDEVSIGDIARSKSGNVKATFLVGVNDGVFPTPKMSEGILSDKERAYLAQNGVELASDTRVKTIEQQFLIYKALNIPQKYLYLSFSTADAEGKALRPAPIFTSLKRIFPKISFASDAIDEKSTCFDKICNPKVAFYEILTQLRKKKNGEIIEDIWEEVLNYLLDKKEWETSLKIAMEGLGYNNRVKKLSNDAMDSLYGNSIFSSVSRLERYSYCPFSYFAQYGIGLNEREIYSINQMDIGILLHSVVEKVCRHIGTDKESFLKVTNKDIEVIIDSITKNIIENDFKKFSGSAKSMFMFEQLKELSIFASNLMIKQIQAGEFIPIGYEVEFGPGRKLPSFSIPLKQDKKILLTGKIDRLDAYQTSQGSYLRIVDYKTGNKKLDITDIYNGLSLQLITYLHAARGNNMENLINPLLPGGVFYLKLDKPLIRTEGKVDDEEIEKMMLKELKLKGMVLNDKDIVKAMDKNLSEGKASDIIPVSLKKDGSFGAYSSAYSLENFNVLEGFTVNKIKEIGDRIMAGDIRINPYRRKQTNACMYCSYSSICCFEPGVGNNCYRQLKEIKEEEFFENESNKMDK